MKALNIPGRILFTETFKVEQPVGHILFVVTEQLLPLLFFPYSSAKHRYNNSRDLKSFRPK